MMRKLYGYCIIAVLICSCKTDSKYFLELGEIHESDYFYSLDIDFPIVSSNKKSSNANLFNADVKQLVETTKSSCEGESLVKIKQTVDESRSKTRYVKSLKHDLFCVYHGLYSVRFTIYEYALGAHGNSFYKSINYNIKEGQRMFGDDIIDRSTPEKLSNLVEVMNLYLEDPSGCFDLTKESIEQNIENINFTSNDIIFSFSHYELGAYACGTAIIRIPIEQLELRGLIKPHFLDLITGIIS